MTFSEMMGEEEITWFGVYFVCAVSLAVVTALVAVIFHLDSESEKARLCARAFFLTPVWPVIALLFVIKWAMLMYDIAFKDEGYS